ncbi:hypothetical protein [Crassaminicella profunda]|uniref:hypothetical protein n=1 Tax=Crassaminicella profunda TaxID=1286698 RepID=UPI001CA6E2D3|nr:hypothetical protein [Crassaminicella profunda]QZY55971.1 hypothetical protein K7H06_02835 [Crassaminicella profunda]
MKNIILKKFLMSFLMTFVGFEALNYAFGSAKFGLQTSLTVALGMAVGMTGEKWIRGALKK